MPCVNTEHTTSLFSFFDYNRSKHKSATKQDAMPKDQLPPTIGVKDLTFAFPDGTTGLKNISLDLPGGSRTLLIGGMSSPSSLLAYTEC